MDRAGKVRQAADAFLQMCGTGDQLSEHEFIETNRDLMPELGEELRMVRLISSARTRAKRTSGEDRDFATSMFPNDSGDPVYFEPEPVAFRGYEAVEKLQRGGQGIVYSAIQKGTNRKVAIKVLREGPFADPRDRVRFEREVQLLGVLRHPCVVTIHESGTTAGHFYYVMDFIEGVALDVWGVRQGRNVEKTITCFEEICNAVNAAHLRGVIHRDLKPGNILVDADDKPHILDFGLAKVAGDTLTTMTETGHFVGSVLWASPEQAQGSSTPGVDIRTDVYSLGVLLYSLLTGRFPYEVAGGLAQIMDNIATVEPIRPRSVRRDIDSELETIILKCLNKDPERRYQSAGELAKDLGRYRTGEPIEAKRDSGWYMFRKTIRRNRLSVSVACAFMVVVTAFGYVNWRESRLNQQLADIVLDLFESDLNDSEHGNFAQRLDIKAARLVEGLQHQPEMRSKIMEAASSGLMGLGEWQLAIPWLRRQIALSRDVLKSDDRAIAIQMCRLANALVRAGTMEEADSLYSIAIEYLRGVSQGPDENLAYALSQHGKFLGYYLGEHERGRALVEAALEMRRSIHAGDHRIVASQLHNLGNYYHNMARFEMAARYYQEGIDMYKRLAPNFPMWSHNEWMGLLFKDMANYSGRKEKYAEAERFINEAVIEVKLIHGEESSQTARVLASLAKLQADSRQYVAAAETCDQALRVSLEIHGSNNRDTVLTDVLCGRIRIGQGRYNDAAARLRPAAEALKELLPGHWETAKAQSLLGAALAGMAGEARTNNRRAEAERLFKEAEHLLVNAYPIIKNDRKEGHYRTREAIERIIFLYAQWEKPDRIDEWRSLISG